MENMDYIRTKERLEYLKKEFSDHVIDVSNAIRTIERRSIKRNEQMDDLNRKMDNVLDTMNDSKYSTKKGVVTQTIENSNTLQRIQNEMAAWKRAMIIIGTLFTGLVFAGRYLWVLLKNILKSEL
jgi:hypothetical protein